MNIDLLQRTIAALESKANRTADDESLLEELGQELYYQIGQEGQMVSDAAGVVRLNINIAPDIAETLKFWMQIKGTTVTELMRRMIAIGNFMLSNFSFDADGKPTQELAIIHPEGIEPRMEQIRLSPDLFS